MANILICDDELNIVETIGDILKDEGHKVFKSDSGLKGLSICEKNKIDIALVDIWMPVLNGVDLLAKIKKIKPEIEVIMISGHANMDMVLKSIKLGAFDFIEKPPSLQKIITVINRALKRQKKK